MKQSIIQIIIKQARVFRQTQWLLVAGACCETHSQHISPLFHLAAICLVCPASAYISQCAKPRRCVLLPNPRFFRVVSFLFRSPFGRPSRLCVVSFSIHRQVYIRSGCRARLFRPHPTVIVAASRRSLRKTRLDRRLIEWKPFVAAGSSIGGINSWNTLIRARRSQFLSRVSLLLLISDISLQRRDRSFSERIIHSLIRFWWGIWLSNRVYNGLIPIPLTHLHSRTRHGDRFEIQIIQIWCCISDREDWPRKRAAIEKSLFIIRHWVNWFGCIVVISRDYLR